MLDTIPDTLIVPLVIATLFTAGGILIQKLERHAESIAVVLGLAFIIVTMLDVLAVSQRWAAANIHHVSQPVSNELQLHQTSKQLSLSNLTNVD